MTVYTNKFQGLNDQQVLESRQKYGANKLVKPRKKIWKLIYNYLINEPMQILLLITVAIYLFTNKLSESIFLLGAIFLLSIISFYQRSKSSNALNKLRSFFDPKAFVIRNNQINSINQNEIVHGDLLMAEEGNLIAADGEIIQSYDFSLNESVLTGESSPVFKSSISTDNQVYTGTTVNSGKAIILVNAIGANTQISKIGLTIDEIQIERSPLEVKINHLVKIMIFLGSIIFFVIGINQYLLSKNFIESLLAALNLAMSILPEEIPVAFTSFMALGARKLMQNGVIVKQVKTIETLGSATVICLDKTGTITENLMELVELYDYQNKQYLINDICKEPKARLLIEKAMLASEKNPFDTMEKSVLACYDKLFPDNHRESLKLIKEYPLSGTPPMMTHVFEDTSGKLFITSKGAPETIFSVCNLEKEDLIQVNNQFDIMAKKGYRVLGIAFCVAEKNLLPENQLEFRWNFVGLIAFYDPPKKNIDKVINQFYEAGINVKLITGDHSQTGLNIAKKIGIKNSEFCLTGEQVMALNTDELNTLIQKTAVFTRMFPLSKLKVIEVLKSNREVVAMTGDGVNDAPALKAAHIGIAMGKKGTEIAKQSASLVLIDDDLSKMIDAIALGRKIHANLKKAILYIISIHLPIILMVFFPLIFNWKYPFIFSALHIIFFEIIMGPICSIVYENEPMEQDALKLSINKKSTQLFNYKEILISVLQGLLISAGLIVVYLFGIKNDYQEKLIRTLIFVSLISSNMFLILVNRSAYFSILKTIKYKNPLVFLILPVSFLLLLIMIYNQPISSFFSLCNLNKQQFFGAFFFGFLSVIWIEIYKLTKRIKARILKL